MKQNDISSNLKQWNKLDRYSQWMYHSYERYIGKRVLDVGAGVGNLTKFMLKKCDLVVGVDIFEHQIQIMRKRFKKCSNFKAECRNILEDDIEDLKEYKFDTVVCINVLEHLEDDKEAVMRMKSLLASKGRLVILVPAWQALYSHLDKNVGHHRRYNRGDLKRLATKCQMKVIENKYFNFGGIFPYYLKGKLSKDRGGSFSTDLNGVNSKFYNYMAAFLEPVENKIKPIAGLSEIIIMEKN